MSERLTDEIVALQDDCEIYRAQRDEAWDTIATLRARVAKLEGALKSAREALRLPEWPSKITRNDAIVEIDDALKDTPK